MLNPFVAAALLVAQAAPAERPCITRQEIADVTVVILPYVVEGARERCLSHLSPDAFLARPASTALAERMRAESGSRLASAARGFQKFGDTPRPPGVRDATLVQMMGEAMSGMFLESLEGPRCAVLSDLLEALAPLEPGGIGQLSGAFFAIAGAGRANPDSPPVCPQ